MQETFRQFRLYLIGMWRRRWIGLAASWAITIVGSIYILTLPSQYESSTRIYVDTTSLLGPLLKGIAVESDIDNQVRVMQRTLLSRPNLRQVIRATDLDLEVSTPREMEQLIQELQRRTRVNIDKAGLFLVSFTDEDPELAKNIVQTLLTIFIESNLGASRTDIQRARRFIEDQIANYEKKLRESEQRIAQFRAENVEILGSTNYGGRLLNARSELESAQIDYSDAIVIRDKLREQLERTSRTVDLATSPQVIIGNQQVPSTLGRIRTIQMDLDGLLLRYTENHPDVIVARRQLARLLREYNREKSGESDLPSGLIGMSQIPNPVYDEIQIRFLGAERLTTQTERRLKRAQADMERLKQYASIAPSLDADLSDITREYDVIKRNYSELLARRESARISQAADSETDAVQFRIIEPPEVSFVAVGPNRPLYLLALMLCVVGAGTGVSFARSQLEETFFTSEQIEKVLGIVVLGTVTQVMNAQESAQRSLRNFGFIVATASLAVFFAGLYLVLILFGSGADGTELINLSSRS